MKIYLGQNVFDAALERIRFLFDEFPEVLVNISGGKDSTAVLNLALQVAEEKGRLPLKVYFLDQEAEWQTVIDYIRNLMTDPRIQPCWLQVPFKIFNATSTVEPWLYAWEEGAHWIREKEPNSIKENIYGTDRFAKLYEAFRRVTFPHTKVCSLAGVRAQESPGRLQGLTNGATYKWITWGIAEDKKLEHYTFYPLYDWSYTDVWKAIHDNHWPYCRLYDYMYQYGIPTREMRVSNIHHETAIHTLFYLQEIEADTWNRVTQRISGLSSAGHLQKNFYAPHELPYMFKDWWEYRDHLLQNLIADPDQRERYRETFREYDARYHEDAQLDLVKTEINTILVNDTEGTKLSSFRPSHIKSVKTRGVRHLD